MYQVNQNFPLFLDSEGLPLQSGKIYIGLSGANPETSPTSVYWDEAGTQPAAQPLRTINGMIVRGGTIANIYIASDYSITVRDSNNSLLSYLSKKPVMVKLSDLTDPSGAGLIGFSHNNTYAQGTVGNALQAFINVKNSPYNLLGNGVEDSTVKLQNAINSGAKLIDLAGGIYLVSSRLYFTSPNQTFRNGTILFNGSTSERLGEVSGSDITFENVIFDANQKQPRTGLVWVAANTQRPKFKFCTWQNITGKAWGTNVLNQTYGLLISPYGVVDFEIIEPIFKDLIKYNDNANNTPPSQQIGIGFIGGILFMNEDVSEPTATQTVVTNGKIVSPLFDNIQTILAAGLSIGNQADFNDADCIRTYGYAGGGERLFVEVTNMTVRNVSKRAVKFRAEGSTARGIKVFADGMQYGMICPIDVVDNNTVEDVEIIAGSSAKQVQSGAQWIPGVSGNPKKTKLNNISIDYCITGLGMFAITGTEPLKNLECHNFFANQASAGGILQSAPLPATQENLDFFNIQIYANGNTCRGVDISGATDVSSGTKMKQVYLRNASFSVAGVNNDIDDVTIEISSSTFTASSSTSPLLRIGQNGYGGFQKVSRININAYGLNTSFVNASRPVLYSCIGDNAKYNDFKVLVPDGLSQSYAHGEFYGTDFDVDDFNYTGAGYTFVGVTVAAARATITNSKRHGSGASASQFLYSNNAGTVDVLMEGITDFRPTTAPSITLNNGNRFIVNDVSSKTSNATIVQFGGGIAKTNNLNTF
jgi:hypothetical protein